MRTDLHVPSSIKVPKLRCPEVEISARRSIRKENRRGSGLDSLDRCGCPHCNVCVLRRSHVVNAVDVSHARIRALLLVQRIAERPSPRQNGGGIPQGCKGECRKTEEESY